MTTLELTGNHRWGSPHGYTINEPVTTNHTFPTPTDPVNRLVIRDVDANELRQVSEMLIEYPNFFKNLHQVNLDFSPI